MEKYKGTPLYKEIKQAFNGNTYALSNVLADENVQKDIVTLLNDKEIRDILLDIAPSKEMKESVKNLLEDKEIKEQLFDIVNRNNVDENVKKIMENSNVQNFVKSVLSNPEIRELIKERIADFPMKNRLFDSLDNPIVQFGLIKTIMSNDIVQKSIADMIKGKHSGSLDAVAGNIIKALSNSNNFLNNSATIMQVGLMGGMTTGAAAGDVIGSYIPIIGRPLFSVTGAVTGTVLGGITGVLGSLGCAFASPFLY